MKTQRVHVWGHFSAPGLFRVWRVAREWYVNDRTWGCSWRCQGQVSHPLRLDFSGSVWFTKCPACISTFSKSLVLHQTKIELLIPMCHWPSQEPKLEAYVREYHHKIWPKIWYSTSILGSITILGKLKYFTGLKLAAIWGWFPYCFPNPNHHSMQLNLPLKSSPMGYTVFSPVGMMQRDLAGWLLPWCFFISYGIPVRNDHEIA